MSILIPSACDHSGNLFRNHHSWCIEIATCHEGHDRRIRNPKRFYAVNPPRLVTYREVPGTHRTRPARVILGAGISFQPADHLGIVDILEFLIDWFTTDLVPGPLPDHL